MLMGDSILDKSEVRALILGLPEVKALIADFDLVPGRASRFCFQFSQHHQEFLSKFSADARRELDRSLLNYYHYARLHPRKVKDNELYQFNQLNLF